ncbi:hypothetical protein GCM10028805_56040 [Spirosoma harenae]
MYQKLTYYLFPFLCIKAIVLLVALLCLLMLDQYFWAFIAFLLLMFTNLLIIVFNQFMMRDDLTHQLTAVQSQVSEENLADSV